MTEAVASPELDLWRKWACLAHRLAPFLLSNVKKEKKEKKKKKRKENSLPKVISITDANCLLLVHTFEIESGLRNLRQRFITVLNSLRCLETPPSLLMRPLYYLCLKKKIKKKHTHTIKQTIRKKLLLVFFLPHSLLLGQQWRKPAPTELIWWPVLINQLTCLHSIILTACCLLWMQGFPVIIIRLRLRWQHRHIPGSAVPNPQVSWLILLSCCD